MRPFCPPCPHPKGPGARRLICPSPTLPTSRAPDQCVPCLPAPAGGAGHSELLPSHCVCRAGSAVLEEEEEGAEVSQDKAGMGEGSFFLGSCPTPGGAACHLPLHPLQGRQAWICPGADASRHAVSVCPRVTPHVARGEGLLCPSFLGWGPALCRGTPILLPQPPAAPPHLLEDLFPILQLCLPSVHGASSSLTCRFRLEVSTSENQGTQRSCTFWFAL